MSRLTAAGYAAGWALTPAPLDDRLYEGMSHATGPVTEAIRIGQAQGAYATVFHRQDALMARHEAALMAIWRDMVAALGIAGAIAAFRREAHMLGDGDVAIPALGDTPDAQAHRKREITVLAATAGAGIAAGLMALPAWDKLTDALGAAMAKAAGEGHAAALGVAAHKAGAQGYDWDRAAGDGETEPHPVQAAQAAQGVLYGTARGIARALARDALAGATAAVMAGSVSAVLDAGKALAVSAGHAIMSAFGAAALTVYSRTGTELLNWVGVHDERECEACIANEAGSPYSFATFPGIPQHIRCRCWSEPDDSYLLSSAAYAAYVN